MISKVPSEISPLGSACEIGTLPVAERVTVNLIPKVSYQLDRLQERTKLSRTDIINRAITTYEFIDAHLRDGGEILIRDTRTGEISTLMIM
jgi:hypothetical protein